MKRLKFLSFILTFSISINLFYLSPVYAGTGDDHSEESVCAAETPGTEDALNTESDEEYIEIASSEGISDKEILPEADNEQIPEIEITSETDLTGEEENISDEETAIAADAVPEEEKLSEEETIAEPEAIQPRNEKSESETSSDQKDAAAEKSSEEEPEVAAAESAAEEQNPDKDDNACEAGEIPAAGDADGVPAAGTDTSWGGDLMGLAAAREKAEENLAAGRLNCTLTVAVIDTGINTAHQLFQGRISPASRSFISDSYEDTEGHGTHVAGIIAQNTPSNVQLLILKALDDNKKGRAEDVANAIVYAAEQGADVINLSLGVSIEDDEDDYNTYLSLIGPAIAQAKAAGCIIVAAAGNTAGGGKDLSATGTYPAISENVITVSAVTQSQTKCETSNYGSAVDFCAPGESIYSADISGSAAYQYLSGTSMAAPFVSAAYAYLFMYNGDSTSDELTDILKGLSFSLGDSSQYGAGLPVFSGGEIPYTIAYIHPISRAGDYNSYDGVCVSVSSMTTVLNAVCDVYRREQGTEEFTYIGSLSKLDKMAAIGVYSDTDVEDGLFYDYYVEASGNYYFPEGSRTETATLQAGIEPKNCYYVCENNPYKENGDCYVKAGDKTQIKVIYSPDNTYFEQRKWYSADETIATVDQNGNVTGVSPGRTHVWSEVPYFSYLFLCINVIVQDPDEEEEVITDGKCGDNVYWSLEENAEMMTLVISGSGDMYDYSNVSTAPWYEQKDSISEIRIEDGVSSIGSWAFYEMWKVVSVTGMKNVASIGDYAFWYCTSLSKIDLSEELTTIGNLAFWFCEKAELIIPASVTDLRDRAVATVSNLTVDEKNSCYCSEDGILYDKNKTILLSCSKQTTGTLVIPDTVKTLEKFAMQYANIEQVVFPEELQRIEAYAFADCYSLERIETPDSVSYIGRSAFLNCYNLSDVVLNEGLENINWWMFSNTKISRIEIPKSVKRIEYGAFENTPLTEIIIPEGVSYIGLYAFHDCTQLKTISMPDTIEIIQMGTCGEEWESPFTGCENLETVYYRGFWSHYQRILRDGDWDPIRDLVRIKASGKLGEDLFWKAEGLPGDLTLTISGSGDMPDFASAEETPWFAGCPEITHIVIENGVTGIGRYAFSGCNLAVDITVPEGITYFGINAFRPCNALERFIYTPDFSNAFYIEMEYLACLYTGEEMCPGIYVEKDGNCLESGKDYEIEYKNNTRIGNGLLTICFTGDYETYGNVSLPFMIVSKLIEGENIRAITGIELSADSFIYNGSKQTPEVTVRSGRWVLSRNADFQLVYTGDCVDTGIYGVTAKGIGAYVGSESDTLTFEIVSKDISSLFTDAVLEEVNFACEKDAEEPVLVISGLREGSDYSVTYSFDKDKSVVSAAVEGLGNYTGNLTKTFSVVIGETSDDDEEEENDNSESDSEEPEDQENADSEEKENTSVDTEGNEETPGDTSGSSDNTDVNTDQNTDTGSGPSGYGGGSRSGGGRSGNTGTGPAVRGNNNDPSADVRHEAGAGPAAEDENVGDPEIKDSEADNGNRHKTDDPDEKDLKSKKADKESFEESSEDGMSESSTAEINTDEIIEMLKNADGVVYATDTESVLPEIDAEPVRKTRGPGQIAVMLIITALAVGLYIFQRTRKKK